MTKMREYKISDLGIGRKFQAPSVFGGITIEENIELAVARKHSIYCTTFLKLSKEKKDYMNYVLEFIGLQDKRFKYPGSLSHGEKQWLEIGMLMAAKPQLMLLDEPVAGMGRKETEKTAELLKKSRRTARSSWWSTTCSLQRMSLTPSPFSMRDRCLMRERWSRFRGTRRSLTCIWAEAKMEVIGYDI